jgi:hypothetical protein
MLPLERDNAEACLVNGGEDGPGVAFTEGIGLDDAKGALGHLLSLLLELVS